MLVYDNEKIDLEGIAMWEAFEANELPGLLDIPVNTELIWDELEDGEKLPCPTPGVDGVT